MIFHTGELANRLNTSVDIHKFEATVANRGTVPEKIDGNRPIRDFGKARGNFSSRRNVLPQESALEWLKSSVQIWMGLEEVKLELEFRMWLCTVMSIDLFVPTSSFILFEPTTMKTSIEELETFVGAD